MFCPSCGIEYTVGLNYCNRCGANLSLTLSTNTEVVPLNVTKPALIIGATLLILIVDVSLVRQLSKLINASISSHNLPQPRKAPSLFQKFSRPSTGRLEPVPSVTENTTRFFERPHVSSELEPQKIADE